MATKSPKHINDHAKAFANSLSTSNLIALAILVGALSIVMAFVIGRALVGGMMLNSRVITKKNAASKTINANYDALKGLQGEYSSLGAMRETITTALPTRPSLPQLWSMMETIGNSSGVVTESVSSVTIADNDAPAGGDVEQLPITVSVQGSYAAIETYLKNLELSTRPLRVTNISLSGTDRTVQASLSITTYYQGAADIKIGSEVVK